MQSRLNLILTSGLAMFAMFFGSGNLIFPLAIGVETTGNVVYSIVGLALTGVCVPFLGLMAMVLFSGDRQSAFSYIGNIPAFLLAFAMLCLMGPFGVAARCIIVAYGGINQIFPLISLEIFGIIWSIIAGVIVLWQGGWLNVVGRYLTPVLLFSIVLIVIAGLWQAHTLPPSDISPQTAFVVGLDQGYQTMDLLAAFFFSVTVVNYLYASMPGQPVNEILKTSVAASCVGAALLLFVYIGFVVLGAFYSKELLPIAAEQRLAFVAQQTLGQEAMIITATTIALACLTTFIVLIVLFSQFLTTEVSKGRIPYPWSVFITLGISYAVSLLGFNALAAWIGQALEIAYPALIALSLALIGYKIFRLNFIAPAFWGTLAVQLFLLMLYG